MDKFEIFQITDMRNPNEIVADALTAIHACPDLPNLEQVKAAYLGKSGQLTELLKSLGAMPAEERKSAGARINEAKQAVEAALRSRRDALQQVELDRQLTAETLDVTLPGRGPARGGLHPVSR
ncbi:MAG: phenylalanine--tRNA ligase subunit alpha, partial [Hyphomicrobiaceae bacterium]